MTRRQMTLKDVQCIFLHNVWKLHRPRMSDAFLTYSVIRL